jgi:hypothetical protein
VMLESKFYDCEFALGLPAFSLKAGERLIFQQLCMCVTCCIYETIAGIFENPFAFQCENEILPPPKPRFFLNYILQSRVISERPVIIVLCVFPRKFNRTIYLPP